MRPRTILMFWFKQHGMKDWFGKDKKFDAKIRKKFIKVYEAAARGEMHEWRKTPRGRLAEILLLDQFSRNMFRSTPRAFASDLQALILAQEALRAGADKSLGTFERFFLYLPFEHSESKKMQRIAVRLISKLGHKEATHYARDHKKVIDRFGRFPHRNAILGRPSTAAEKAFLRTHKGY